MQPFPFKLGKAPFKADPRDLRYAAYRKAALPKRPRIVRHSISGDWGELGNDEWGDCVFAGAAHETMVWTKEGGNQAPFNSAAVLSDYSAVTGFNPHDPITDRGTEVRQALLYRQKTGIVDALGNRHKLGAFVKITPSNLEYVLDAIYLFSAVGIGIQMPESAQEQFVNGRLWDVVKNSPVQGGHYVPVVGYTKYLCGLTLTCVTWGKDQELTSEFFARYCDEAWALLSPECLKEGRSPEGFDMTALQADLQTVSSA